MGKKNFLFNYQVETSYDTHFEWQTGAHVLHLQCTENMRLEVVKCSKIVSIGKETLSAWHFSLDTEMIVRYHKGKLLCK